MFCDKCGKELNSGDAFCTNCGAAVNSQNTAEQPDINNTQTQGTYFSTIQAEGYANSTEFENVENIDRKSISKKEFINKYANPVFRKNINSISVLCYVLSAISVAVNLFMTDNFYFLIDIIITLAVVLGMHLGKSKVCAILLLIISIGECIGTTIAYGRPAGWWWIVISIYAVSYFRKIDKEYKEFIK